MPDFGGIFGIGAAYPLLAALVSAALSLAGHRLGVLTRGGAIAAFATGFGVLYFEPRLFPALFAMVALGEISTRIRVRKDLRRAAVAAPESALSNETNASSIESLSAHSNDAKAHSLNTRKLHKPRGAGSVFGNGGVALALAIMAGLSRFAAFGNSPVNEFGICPSNSAYFLLFAAAAGALAAAAADTVSGEIGRAFRAKAVLITTFKPVEIGSNGGVSLDGTLSGIAGSAVIALIAAIFANFGPDFAANTPQFAIIVTISGALGSVFDSVLGATVEGRPFCIGGRALSLGNDGVNFLCTLAGAISAAVIIRFTL